MVQPRKTVFDATATARFATLALVFLLVACESKKNLPEPLSVTVEMTGCSALLDGPACAIEGDARIVLWTKHPVAALRVSIDESPIESKMVAVQGGTRIEVPVHHDSLGKDQKLVLQVHEDNREGAFRLPLVSWTTPEVIRDVDKLRKAFKFEEAAGKLDGLHDEKGLSLQAFVWGRRARMALAQGKSDQAIVDFQRAIDFDGRAGIFSSVLRDRAALSYTLAEKNRFAEAREALAPLESEWSRYSESRAMFYYHQGVIAHRSGDLRKALDDLRSAEEAAERVDSTNMQLDAMEVRADVLRLLGRQVEAREGLARIAELLPDDAGACRRAGLFTNIGWNLLDDVSSKEDPQTYFDRAIEIYRSKCPNSTLLANALTNVARVFVNKDAFEEAARFLGEARKAESAPTLSLATEQLELEAHIEFGLAHEDGAKIKKALGHYENLGRIAETALMWDLRWIAALGKARCFEALRDLVNAKKSYADAEKMLDESSLLAPLGEGRGLYLEKRAASARRYLELLVRGKDREAVNVARHSLARNVASLARLNRTVTLDAEKRQTWEKAVGAYRIEREGLDKEVAQAWTLSKSRLDEFSAQMEKRAEHLRQTLDATTAMLSWGNRKDAHIEMVSPAEGELFLILHPLVGARWVVMAARRDDVRFVVLEELNPQWPASKLAEVLLEPLAQEIENAKSLRVLSSSSLHTIDVHALPWKGSPLLARMPVVYGVDVDVPRNGDENSKNALVVIDPRGDLPGARTEGQTLVKRLAEGGFHVFTLEGEAATYSAMRDALEKPDLGLFHFAGHGLSRGYDGFESALPLGGKGAFGVGDVLALRSVPHLVILSGCETFGVGLGLSQAFKLVGAHAVIAAPRPVEDRTTEQLMRLFFGEWLVVHDAAEALRRAEIELAKREGYADWAGFRVIVP